MAQKWCTIESDPGVFTELISKIGVNGVQVEELMTLEDEDLAQVKPIYGLIFLFKWVADKEPRVVLKPDETDPELFYAYQTINNACATQAILSILMNRQNDIDIGQELNNLRSFSMGLQFKDRGHAIGNSDVIRKEHNSFARNDPFIIEESNIPDKDGDAFHFISYVPVNERLYELDGLQKGPICFGECSEETWLPLAREQIQKRIEKYAGSEIRFNLLALVGDKLQKMKKQFEELAGQIQNATDELIIQELQSSQTMLQDRIQEEELLRQQWRNENSRRRHNYVPLIFELLKQLAEKNKLEGLFKTAVDKKIADKNKKAGDVEMN